MHDLPHLSHADAARMIDEVRGHLETEAKGAAVAVVDTHGELIAFLRTDGCPLPSITIAINKAYTAARHQSESRELGEQSVRDGFPMTNFGDLRYVTWGGGIPLRADGLVVGGIGVSGLPETEDIWIARRAAALIG